MAVFSLRLKILRAETTPYPEFTNNQNEIENILLVEHPSTRFGTLRARWEEEGLPKDIIPLTIFPKSARKSMNLDNSLESLNETGEQSKRKNTYKRNYPS
jgi:hypothetical protein